MNSYQKIAIFAMRTVGSIAAIFSLSGFLYYLLLDAFSGPVIDATTEQILHLHNVNQHLSANLFWVVLGIALIILSRPIGLLIGRGLE